MGKAKEDDDPIEFKDTKKMLRCMPITVKILKEQRWSNILNIFVSTSESRFLPF